MKIKNERGVEDHRAGQGSGTIYMRRFDRFITEREVVESSRGRRGFERVVEGVEGGRIESSRVVKGSRGSIIERSSSRVVEGSRAVAERVRGS